jgi:competence protein ComEA
MKDYLTFTRFERRGISVLSVILVLLIFAERILPYILEKPPSDHAQYEAEINAFIEERNRAVSEAAQQKSVYTASSVHAGAAANELFPFNPNHLPEEEWTKLGLSPKQIKTIRNYESKGGKFYKKEDLKKIWGISESLYNRLEPYIKIPPRENNADYTSKEPVKQEKKQFQPLVIELNAADSAALISLRGIGPSYASRILKYRDLLGGYIRKEQLMEVYGMTEELYNSVIPFISVDPARIKPININTCDKNELGRHPYISWNLAESLINYRTKHGLYRTVEDIKKSDLVNDELYLKLAVYLKAE